MNDDRRLQDEGELTTADIAAPRREPGADAPQPRQQEQFAPEGEARRPEAFEQEAEPRQQEQFAHPEEMRREPTLELRPEQQVRPEAEPEGAEPLFPSGEAAELRDRWNAIQAGFVDEPRRAVEQADGLVAQAIKRVAETFAGERSRLEAQWDGEGDVDTEDLRQALRRYRSFFDRILSV